MSHSASSKIPRPKGDIRVGIQSKMGLENDRELYEQIQSCIHRLAGEYLDMDEAFSYQDRAKMRLLFLEALREYPLLKRFENGWPVKGLLQKLLRVSNGHRSKGPNCAAAKSASTSTTSAASQNAQGNRASSCSSPPSRPARQAARPFQRATASARQSPPSLQTYLTSLGVDRPSEILHLLNEAGISTQHELQNVLKWSRAERDVFFRTEVGMTVYQYKSFRRQLHRGDIPPDTDVIVIDD